MGGKIDSKQPMIIAGSGRSGTTWVLDVIASTYNLRPIFEPLNSFGVKGAEAYAWKYVTRDSNIHGMEEFFDKIFTGQLSSLWTDFRVPPCTIFPHLSDLSDIKSIKQLRHNWMTAIRQFQDCRSWRSREQLIVKCIRCNLLLDWLVARFNAKVLLLVRHPGAVVESKLRIGGISWDPERMLNTYRQDANLKGLRGGLYWGLLSKDLTPAQALTLLWCIENQVPMADATANGYLIVHYEDLVDQGEPVWDRIAEFFGLVNRRWDDDLLSRPSQQASGVWQGRKGPLSSHSNWIGRIEPQEMSEIAEILKVTGEEVYDAHDPRPHNLTAPS